MAEETSAQKTKRQPSGAFMKPVKPDEKLAQIIGDQPLARTEVTKKLWDYIRGHNLQDPANKTFIKADDKLTRSIDPLPRDGGNQAQQDRLACKQLTKTDGFHFGDESVVPPCATLLLRLWDSAIVCLDETLVDGRSTKAGQFL